MGFGVRFGLEYYLSSIQIYFMPGAVAVLSVEDTKMIEIYVFSRFLQPEG